MSTESAFASGGNKYYVVDKGSRVLVYKTSWIGREFVGEVHDLAEAFSLIKSDSGSSKIEAR